jgi:hypothetical protein
LAIVDVYEVGEHAHRWDLWGRGGVSCGSREGRNVDEVVAETEQVGLRCLPE